MATVKQYQSWGTSRRTALAESSIAAAEANPIEPKHEARLAPILLLMSSLGYLLNNIAVAWVFDFAITIPLILFVITAAIMVLSPKDRASSNLGIYSMCFVIVVWELIRALLLGTLGQAEWMRSAAQFFTALLCFTFISSLRIGPSSLKAMANVLVIIAILFGGLGVLQTVMLNVVGVHTVVPSAVAVSTWDPAEDVWRTQGIQRAAVFSSEPGFYSASMALVFILLLFYRRMGVIRSRVGFSLALIFALAGLGVSLAPSGWFMLMAGLITAVLVGHIKGGFRIAMILFAITVTVSIYSVEEFSFIRSRVNDILSGEDESLQSRLAAPMQLLWRPADDFFDFVSGRGIGVEDNYKDLIDGVYWRKNYSTIINNTFAYIRVTQGWSGVLFYLMMLTAAFRPTRMKLSLYLPLIATFIASNFIISSYLSNYVWSIIALISVLRRIDPWPVFDSQY